MSLVEHVNEATRRAEQELKGQEIQPLLDKGEELKLVADKRGLLREGDVKLLKMGGSGSLKKVEVHALLFDRIHIPSRFMNSNPCRCLLSSFIIGRYASVCQNKRG
jgi:hypothetical protein